MIRVLFLKPVLKEGGNGTGGQNYSTVVAIPRGLWVFTSLSSIFFFQFGSSPDVAVSTSEESTSTTLGKKW